MLLYKIRSWSNDPEKVDITNDNIKNNTIRIETIRKIFFLLNLLSKYSSSTNFAVIFKLSWKVKVFSENYFSFLNYLF